MKKILIALFLAAQSFFIHADPIFGNPGDFITTVLDTPQSFFLGTDIVAASSTVFEITACDVILDLGEHIVSSGLNGVVIGPDAQNVEIRNGVITNMQNAGIIILPGCSGIILKNLSIRSCDQIGIDINGTNTNIVQNIQIQSVSITDSASTSSAVSVFSAEFCNNLIITKSEFLNNGSLIASPNVISITDCNLGTFESNLALNNTGTVLHVVNLTRAQNCSFTEFNVRGNTTSSDSLVCFRCTDTCVTNIFNHCVITNNTSAGIFIGIELSDESQENLIESCKIVNNTGTTFDGIFLHGTGTPSNNQANNIGSSGIIGNTASSGNSNGIRLSRSDNGIINTCKIAANTASSGTAAGILFESGTGGNNWLLKQSEIARNFGTDDDSSFGVHVATGNENVFIKNISFNNGTSICNQLRGVPVGSIAEQTPDNLNSTKAPWTNLVIVP